MHTILQFAAMNNVEFAMFGGGHFSWSWLRSSKHESFESATCVVFRFPACGRRLHRAGVTSNVVTKTLGLDCLRYYNYLRGYRVRSSQDAVNQAKHGGVSLAAAARFDIDTALVVYDDRAAPEDCCAAVGFIDAVLHVLAFTERNGRIRPISLRKAEKVEVRDYETHKARYGF